MIKTGSEDLNNFLQGYSIEGITTIYGEAGTGKTMLCLLFSIEQASNNKKVLFLDAENNFSTERFEQLAFNNKDCIKNILILKIKNFNLQHTQIKNLENVKNVGLIVVDSITHFYRRLYRREPEVAKGMLAKQLRILNNISKNNIPIMITSQVYSNLDNKILPLGKYILNKFSKVLIKLEKNPRKLIIKKPDKKETYFKIINEGIKIT